MFVDVQVFVVDTLVQVVGVLEHYRAAGVHQQLRRGRAGFDDGATRSQVAAQHTDTGFFLERIGQRQDHLRVVVFGVFDVVPHTLAGGRDDVLVQVFGNLFHHHRQTTRVTKVFHQVLARGLQVHQAGQVGRQAVEVVQCQVHTDTPGNRQQVDYQVGGATHGCVDLDGVFDRLAGQDLRHDQIFMHHVHNTPPRHTREYVAAAINSRVGRIAGQTNTQRLDHAGHGAGGAHGHAVAVAAVHTTLGLVEVLHGELACAHHLTHLPHTGARAQLLPAPFAAEHRSTRHTDRRDVHTGRAHHQRRCGFVAAHQQHHTVERVGADGFLHVHAGQIAVEHGGRPHQGLAERHDRELQREATGLVHPNLHLLGQRTEVAVAGRQLAEGVADANHRAAIELVVWHTFALDPAAVDKPIAVLTPPPLLAAEFFGFFAGFGCGAHGGVRVKGWGRGGFRVNPESSNVLCSYHCAVNLGKNHD